MQASAFPPSYSASSPAPYYSSVPLEGEERIEYTSSTTVSENITKACSFLTVIFKDQDATEDFPTYGRGSTIHGEIGLKSNAGVLSVSVKLKGHLHLSISDSGSISITVVSESIELWTRDPARCNPCPSVLPFAIKFPQNFTHGERSRPIPPSFHEAFYQQPVVSAQCSYLLKVTVRYGGTKMAFWKPSRSYSLQLNYRPRTRPQRPISHLGRFTSTMKQVPEDWLQIESTMRVRETATVEDSQSQQLVFSTNLSFLGQTEARIRLGLLRNV